MTMDYEVHLPEYLAKCINLARPQLHCNGQCVLMQKVKENEKEENRKNLVVYEYSALHVHKDYPVFKMSCPQRDTSESQFMPYLMGYHYAYNNAIFRPPIAA